jgi:arsenite oxidase small subunit
MTANEDKKGVADGSGGSRRDFLKVALTISVFLASIGVLSVLKSIVSPAQSEQAATATMSTGTGSASPFPRVLVANLSDIKVNQPVLFNYPLEEEPNVLVKLGQKAVGGVGPDGDVVAFSQICQHLGCVYAYTRPGSSPACDSSFVASGPVGYCCCHGSVFDFADGGKVVGGPSPRPVPQVVLEVDESSGNVYAVAMGPPTVFGYDTGSSNVLADLQGGTPVS